MPDQPSFINSVPRLTRYFLCFALLLAVGLPAPAQVVTRRARKKRQKAAASAPAEGSSSRGSRAQRARRAAPAAEEVTTEPLAAEKETKEPAEADGTNEPATNETEEPVAESSRVVTVDELRTRIQDEKPGPVRASLQKLLVAMFVSAGLKADAIMELRSMAQEDRYDPAFFYNTANWLARLGDASAAADAYRKAISQRRGIYARALNNLGVILTRQGRWDEAHTALTAALAQENNAYAEASYNLGRLYLLRGEGGLAIRQWSRTLKLEPDHADATAALARAYAADGDARRGLTIIDAYVARAARTGTIVPAGLTLARRELSATEAVNKSGGNDNNNPASSRDIVMGTNAAGGRATPVSRSFSVDPATYKVLQSARDARERGQHELAVKQYRDVIARSRDNYFAPANLELGLSLINLRRPAEAAAALRVVADKDGSRYPVVHFHLGRLHEQLGQLELAALHFNRAVMLYGDQNPQAVLNLSGVYEKQGDIPGALVAMESYMRIMGEQGSLPEWATERLAKLKEKAAASAATMPPPAPKP